MTRKKHQSRWHLAIIVLLMIGFYYWKPLTNAADTAAATMAGSIIHTYHALANKIHAMQHWFTSNRGLEQELARVTHERELLLAQLATCNAEERYKNDIYELTQFRQQYKQFEQARIVQILMKHFGPEGHYFLIRGGSNDGFKINMVATINNHLIGRVAEVYPTYSKLQLITDSIMKVAACSAQTKAQGIFTGTNNTHEATLNFVDHLQEISINDMVLTSGTGLVYPPGLCLGTITRAIKKDISYEIYVKPLIDLEKLTYCLLSPAVTDQPPITNTTVTIPEPVSNNAMEQSAEPTTANATEETIDQAEEDAD